GLLEAAFAGALEVRLGGENRYGGRVEPRPLLGEGRLPGPPDVERAIRLSSAVGSAAVLLLALLAAVAGPRDAGAQA
ncbi:MAG: cobalamin biosynthesis protein, partial [Thermoleophilaceae bacterium]